MRIPFSILFSVLLSLETFAAPVSNDIVGNEFALEVRKAKTVKRPAAKRPVAVAKKPVAKKPVAKSPVAKKPVAKKPVAKKPVAKKPVAKKPVAKKPTTTGKKPPTKPPTKATKPPAKASKAPTKSAAKPSASASAKPKKCTAKELEARFEERELEKRVAVRHPSARGTITLFHGASTANANALASSRVDLSKTRGTGDFNHRPEVAGGFYMSDSLVAAAQFACFGIPGQKPAKVDVLQFKWKGAGVAVKEFPSENADWKNFQVYNSNPNEAVDSNSPFAALAAEIYTNAMIAGPLNGPVDFDLTDDFQQYAIVDQAAADNNLVLEKHHKGIICKNIPKGNAVTAGLYSQGQAGNAKFNTRLAKLQDPNFRPGGGSCVIQ